MRSHTQRLMVCAASFAALCMGLAGCGSNTASTGGDSGEVVNLTYMHRLPDSEGMTLVKDIVAKWNKDHPSIQVKATKFDGAAQDMIKKLETDVKAGNAPDLAQVGYAEVPEVFTKGLLEDVTEEAAKYKSDFAEGRYSMMQVDGKTYGLPQDTGPLVYFYNQKAFDELGIKVPKTKDELIEAAKTAAASGTSTSWITKPMRPATSSQVWQMLPTRGTPSRMTLGWSTPTAAVRRLLLKPSRN